MLTKENNELQKQKSTQRMDEKKIKRKCAPSDTTNGRWRKHERQSKGSSVPWSRSKWCRIRTQNTCSMSQDKGATEEEKKETEKAK